MALQIPEGYALVPIEPTREMLTAFAVAFNSPAPKGPNPTNSLDRMDLIAATVWKATLAASPSPKSEFSQ